MTDVNIEISETVENVNISVNENNDNISIIVNEIVEQNSIMVSDGSSRPTNEDVSADDNNQLQIGSDGKFFVSPPQLTTVRW